MLFPAPTLIPPFAWETIKSVFTFIDFTSNIVFASCKRAEATIHTHIQEICIEKKQRSTLRHTHTYAQKQSLICKTADWVRFASAIWKLHGYALRNAFYCALIAFKPHCFKCTHRHIHIPAYSSATEWVLMANGKYAEGMCLW